ncbi:universal stress protein [Sphaerospermopsis kisseleviana CS-549]|uniref:Universal stress protein n=1 Tax=Sphaerospermopsis kisseleviana CS-549 TaxID=3021783 RepID=A0ABT4ZRC2_9CYAN|nr:universal stress protein [Sphaerospermopsis kisseleviana]MDB9441323.1 universal stress protein [Sphaerospermopsis kisseleviana CS-549]
MASLLLIHHSFQGREVKAVKIKPLLARLQGAIGRHDLIEQMVLLPAPKKCLSEKNSLVKSIKLIVGYDGSPNSHTALDIAFCIAHQTHLASNIQVNVQAVYVLEEQASISDYHKFNYPPNWAGLTHQYFELSQSTTMVLTPSKPQLLTTSAPEKADKILWQAKNLAQEWQSDFKSHLRFGNLSNELKKVVELETADALVLGCQSINHPVIESLDPHFPCAVLGIPRCLD